jgi:long-chain acyl-CoA synthetase
MVFKKKDRIFFAGRKDSLINIGGNKIYLEQIEKTIEECDNVRTANCKAVEHKFLNQIIIATVSLDKADKTSLSIEKTNIRRHCIEMLPKFAVPAKIEFIKNVKLSTNSKMIRKL